MKVGVSGFGGVLPFARRMLVDERHWMTEREFTEVLSLSQFLPGPNIINVSIIVGSRYQGPRGSIAASLGLMLMPFLIVLALAALYSRFDTLAAVRDATAAVSSAATGLIMAMGLKMARPLSGVGMAGGDRRAGVHRDRAAARAAACGRWQSWRRCRSPARGGCGDDPARA